MALELPRTWRARLDPNERYGLRLTLVLATVLILAIPFAYLTFNVVGAGPLTRLDGRVADSLNAWAYRRPGTVRVLEWVSRLANLVTLSAVAAIAAVSLWRTGRHRMAVFLVVTSAGGGIIDTLVKVAVNRPRPIVDHPVATALGKSFPSGHTMSATVVYGALLVAFWRMLPKRWRPVAVAATVCLVLAVASSRLLLGVHFLSDVIGGFLLGIAWLSGSTAAFKTWRHDLVLEKVNVRSEAGVRRRPDENDPSVPCEDDGDERLG